MGDFCGDLRRDFIRREVRMVTFDPLTDECDPGRKHVEGEKKILHTLVLAWTTTKLAKRAGRIDVGERTAWLALGELPCFRAKVVELRSHEPNVAQKVPYSQTASTTPTTPATD